MSVEFYSKPVASPRIIPYQTLDTPLKERKILPTSEHNNWLNEYEKLEGNIFKYYNVQNEIDFLKKADRLPDEKKHYYLQENVKRFLGEFVGKVPYTTVPYEVDENGITYAGMHVMDSYKKAQKLAGEREYVETQGFEDIEKTYTFHLHNGRDLPTGVWISPPKTADYGFVFVFIPDAHGHLKEYVLRYPEPIDSLEKSKKIYSTFSPSNPPESSDAFLMQPLFDRTHQDPKHILNSVMQQMDISPKEIEKSHKFEHAVDSTLSEWIDSYCSLIMSLALYENGSPLHRYGVLEAKKRLLSIYQKAEEIQLNLSNLEEHAQPTFLFSNQVPLSADALWEHAAALQYQERDLPTTSEGSCPAIQNTSDPFSSPSPFMDNLTALQSLSKHIPLERAFQNADSFPCPKCGGAIPSGKGLEICPHCGITKQQYAKLVNGQQCD